MLDLFGCIEAEDLDNRPSPFASSDQIWWSCSTMRFPFGDRTDDVDLLARILAGHAGRCRRTDLHARNLPLLDLESR